MSQDGFGHQTRHGDEKEQQYIGDQEGTTPVLAGDIRQSPDVAGPDNCPHHGHQKAETTPPLLANGPRVGIGVSHTCSRSA